MSYTQVNLFLIASQVIYQTTDVFVTWFAVGLYGPGCHRYFHSPLHFDEVLQALLVFQDPFGNDLSNLPTRGLTAVCFIQDGSDVFQCET